MADGVHWCLWVNYHSSSPSDVSPVVYIYEISLTNSLNVNSPDNDLLYSQLDIIHAIPPGRRSVANRGPGPWAFNRTTCSNKKLNIAIQIIARALSHGCSAY